MKPSALVACMFALLLSAGPVGSSTDNSRQNLITMNFQNVDVSVLAKFISDITGKNFVLDESVRGKVSVV
jgi:general secretion pathway protein D